MAPENEKERSRANGSAPEFRPLPKQAQTAYADSDTGSNGKPAKRKPRRRLAAIGPRGQFIVTGQVAKALVELVRRGAAGVTALEVNSWAYRLGAYVFILRHDYGLAIETVHEPHDNGWHGRYVLHTPVVIGEPGQ
jgi:hypothetical protein